MLSDKVKEILRVPSYYTDEYNATPMKNYWPILKPIFESFQPKSICEIGSERGLTTKLIMEEFHSLEAIHVVDPAISSSIKALQQDNLHLHEQKSIDYLKDCAESDIYFVDGDHNYYTVTKELELIEQKMGPDSKKFIFIHDVSWFWGRRNLYYDQSNIPDIHTHVSEGALVLENEHTDAIQGFRFGEHYSVAEKYGGKENGVLTAIENFVSNSALDWHFSSIPSLYGLGFLWLDANLDEKQKQHIQAEIRKLESINPFLGILEANRLRLLQGLNEWKDLAEEYENSYRHPLSRWMRKLGIIKQKNQTS